MKEDMQMANNLKKDDPCLTSSLREMQIKTTVTTTS